MQQGVPKYRIYIEIKKERIKPKKGELHELQYKEIIKSGTVRLASGFVLICGYGLWKDDYDRQQEG